MFFAIFMNWQTYAVLSSETLDLLRCQFIIKNS